jgi:hypothetical protein
MTKEVKSGRLTLPGKVEISMKDTVLVPDVQSAMTNAVTIIANELARYCSKTTRGVTLDLKEARIVKEYIAALVSLSKEAREAAKQEDLSNLTNEEILELAQKVLLTSKTQEAKEDIDEDNE